MVELEMQHILCVFLILGLEIYINSQGYSHLCIQTPFLGKIGNSKNVCDIFKHINNEKNCTFLVPPRRGGMEG